MDIGFKIKKDSGRGYVVIRDNGLYEQHAHLSTMNGCRLLMSFVKQNRMPNSKYLQVSCARLLTEEEYKTLKPKKQQYVNVNKGVRR